MAILFLPILLLNLFSGLVGGIWLAILGDWNIILFGLALTFVGAFILSLFLLPSFLLIAPVAANQRISESKLMIPLALLSIGYTYCVMGSWALLIFWYFAESVGSNAAIPTVLWSYSTATVVWNYMALKDAQNEYSTLSAFFNQVGCIALMFYTYNNFSDPNLYEMAVWFGSPMLISLFIHVWMASVKQSRATGDAKQSPTRETKSSHKAKFSPEVDAIFEKIDRVMTDERVQNNGLPEPIRSEILSGTDCDEIPGAIGEFGRDPRNPIPVNGPLGEVIYLSNLITAKSQPIMFHRLGSIGNVDAYETVSFDGADWDILFLDLYHPRKSRRAPVGYLIAGGKQRQRILLGTNEYVPSFPNQLPNAIANTYERLLGGRMRPRQVREAIERISFNRPNDHQMKFASVMVALSARASPSPKDGPRRVAIIKSGMINGIRYCIFADGSVEIVLPNGPMRFASVDALCAHFDAKN